MEPTGPLRGAEQQLGGARHGARGAGAGPHDDVQPGSAELAAHRAHLEGHEAHKGQRLGGRRHEVPQGAQDLDPLAARRSFLRWWAKTWSTLEAVSKAFQGLKRVFGGVLGSLRMLNDGSVTVNKGFGCV